MADLNNLNIQITASTSRAKTALGDLRREFARLNSALANYSKDSNYVKGLNNLANGLESIASATNNIDVASLTNVATAINNLAKKGTELAKLNFAKPLENLGSQSAKATSQVQRATEDIARAFNITNEEGITELADSVQRFYNSIGNSTGLRAAEKEIHAVISEYIDLGDITDEVYENLRKYVSSTNLAIPKDAISEFANEYKRLRGYLGLKNTSADLSKGIGIDVFAEDLKRLGITFHSDNPVDMMRELTDMLAKSGYAAEEQGKKLRRSAVDVETFDKQISKLYADVGAERKLGYGVDADGMLTVDGPLDIGFDEDELESETTNITHSAQAITNAVEKVNSIAQEVQQVGNPFEGIVKGMQSLEDISITGEQFAGLESLSKVLGKITGSKSAQATTALPLIAKGIEQMGAVQVPTNGEQLAIYADQIKKLGSAAATRAQNIGSVADGLKKFQGMKFENVEEISRLASALAKFGYKNVQTAVDNMPNIAVAFNQLLTTLSKSPKVSEETIRLAEAMGQLAVASRNTGTSSTQAGNGINFLRGAIQAAIPTMQRAHKRTFSLAAMFGKLYASYFLVIRAFRGLGSAIEQSSQLTEVGNVVATVFGEEKSAVEDFADTAINSFGLAELSAQQYASRFQAMGSAMGITNQQVEQATEYLGGALQGTKREVEGVVDSYADLGDSMADMSINLTKLTSDYASFFNMDYDDVAQDFESIFTGMTRPMRVYGIDLTENTLKEWALKQGLDADIDAMTQAEKTMLRYQYVMAHSGKIMNDFAITADTWANVIRTIGQQFVKLGTIIGGGLINTFKPVLIGFRNFMNTFLDLTEKGVNAIGKLLGWQMEITEVGVSMEDSMSDYADDIDDAAGSAKKLNSQLRGIDELNNITSNNGSGSGSGLSGLLDDALGASGGGIKFTEIPKEYESDIDSWMELGLAIRDKILAGFGSIDWDDLSDKVKLNAQGFVDLIKGLLMPNDDGKTLGGEFGRFLAEAINLGFDWLVVATGDKDLWKEIGLNISNFITNLFKSFDAKDAADTIDNIVQGLFEMFKTAVGDLSTPENRNEISGKIKEFFKEIDAETWNIVIPALAIAVTAVTIKKVGSWFISDILAKQILPSLLSSFFSKLPTYLSEMLAVGLANGTFLKSSAATSASAFASKGATAGMGGLAAIVAMLGGSRIGVSGGAMLAEVLNGTALDASAYEDYMDFGGIFKMFGDLKTAISDCIEDTDLLKGAFKSWGEDIANDPNVKFWYDTENGVWAKMGKGIKDFVTQAGELFYGEDGFWMKAYNKGVEVASFFYGEDSIWVRAWKAVSDFFTKAGELIYGEEGFWATLYNKGVEIGEIFYGENSIWVKMWNELKVIWENIKKLFSEKIEVKMPHFKWDKEGNKAPDWAAKALDALGLPTSLPKLTVEWYANGGFPTTGSLFYAGEAGAELLGSVNGKTTVASNGEITGISDTIRQTSSEEIQLLRQQNVLLQGILQKEFGISKDGLFKSVRQSANEYKKQTGNPAF